MQIQFPPLMQHPHDDTPEVVNEEMLTEMTESLPRLPNLPPRLASLSASDVTPEDDEEMIIDAEPISFRIPEGFEFSTIGILGQKLGSTNVASRSIGGSITDAFQISTPLPQCYQPSHPVATREAEQACPFSKSRRKQNWWIESRPCPSPSRVVNKYYYHIESHKQFRSQVEVYKFIEYGIYPKSRSSKRKEKDPNPSQKSNGERRGRRPQLLKSKEVGYYIPKPFGVIHRFSSGCIEKSLNTDPEGENMRIEEGSSGASAQDLQNPLNYPGLPLVDFETIMQENMNFKDFLD